MKNYIDYFLEIKNQKNFNKKSKFNNDFDGLYYFVNNHQRAKQIENKLTKEMRLKNIEVIIPPIIEEYKNGFLYIANLILRNSKSRKFITEYSNEWVVFFMTEIASKAISDIVSAPLKRNVNRKINLAKEYIKFLFDVEEYEAGEKLKELKDKYKNLKPEKFLIEAYDEYIKKRQEYSGDKFFDRVSAIQQLKSYLIKNNKVDKNFIIMIEDFEDMEPIYKTISDLLLQNGIDVIKVNKDIFLQEYKEKKINLYHCMTPLDEAEIIGFNIKKILKDVNPENIAVVVYGNENANSIRFILERYKLYYATSKTMASNEIFQLFKSIVDFILVETPDMAYFINQLLQNNASKFKINKDFFNKINYILVNINELSEKNLILLKDRISDIDDIDVQNTIYKICEFIEQRIKNRNSLLRGGFKNLFKQFINDEEINKIEGARIFSETIEKMDNMIKDINEIDEEVAYKINTSLKIIGDIHYELYNEKNEMFDIPFLVDKKVSNIIADYYFICGFDAKIEKRSDISGTYSLSKELRLPLPEETTKEIIKDVLDLMKKNNYKELNLSYSYFDFNNKEKGIATPVRLLTKIETEEITHIPDIKNNNSLLKAVDVFQNEKEVPATTYMYLNTQLEKEYNSKFMLKEQKFIDIYMQLYNKQEKINDKLIPAIDAYDFCDFVTCKYRFFLKVINKLSGFEEETISEKINMEIGNFWHEFFKKVGVDKNFLDDSKLEKLILDVFENHIKENELRITYFEKSVEYFAMKAHTFVKEFIENEKIRRQKHGKPDEIIVEKQVNFLFKNKDDNNDCLYIKGKIDRIDIYKDKIIIWDYKSRLPSKSETKNFYFLKNKKEEFHNKNSAQIAFYRYLLGNAENIIDKMIYGGIIYLSGEDRLDENNCRLKSNNRDISVDKIVEDKLLELCKFLNEDINFILLNRTEYSLSNDESEYECMYCKVNYICFKD
ncbi:MAG: PD-(D/E)XK nuclease family protein [Candidatus Goldbacteria bacterium]|nr:PD-(D/E)XK nuclease family protein [Candidatus Goldiibacteriota bacterium]